MIRMTAMIVTIISKISLTMFKKWDVEKWKVRLLISFTGSFTLRCLAGVSFEVTLVLSLNICKCTCVYSIKFLPL